jgi:hypothetical protein
LLITQQQFKKGTIVVVKMRVACQEKLSTKLIALTVHNHKQKGTRQPKSRHPKTGFYEAAQTSPFIIQKAYS